MGRIAGKLTLDFDLMAVDPDAGAQGLHLLARDLPNFSIFLGGSDTRAMLDTLRPALQLYYLQQGMDIANCLIALEHMRGPARTIKGYTPLNQVRCVITPA